MALLQLPTELLCTVLDLSRPYAFENLALTCKHMYSAAHPLLARHNELRHKYRCFKFAECGEQPKLTRSIDELTWFVPQLLLDIARDRMVASYIVYADLGQRNHAEGYYCDFENLQPALEQPDARRNKEMLRDLLRDSWLLRSIGADVDNWLDRILADDNQNEQTCDFGLVFLMSLLVNVESLVLPGTWDSPNTEPRERREGGIEPYQYHVSQLMQLLVKLANDGTTCQWPLKRLRKLEPSRDVDTQFGMEMISIAPFLALESMREVSHASGKYICYAGSPSWDTMYPAIGPNIESLELRDYVVDVEAGTLLFQDMKKLKILKMEYSMKDEIGDDWKPNQFVKNLMSAVGKQLEVLSLTINWMYENDDPVTDLSGFTALRKLNLDIELFHHWNITEGDEDPNFPDAQLSILDMLPGSSPNLEKLRLECLPTKADVERLGILLRDFGSSKSMQLPNLTKTTLFLDSWNGDTLRDTEQGNGPLMEKARKMCVEVGNIQFKTGRGWDTDEATSGENASGT